MVRSMSTNRKMDMNCRKRNLTLDLQETKRMKFEPDAHILSTPDCNKLKLTTPEIENIILQNSNILQTPTPNTTQLLDDGDMYDYGNESIMLVEQPRSSSGSNSSCGLRKEDSYMDQYPVTLNAYGSPDPYIKDEPQTVPSLCSSPPITPINMESQECIKLERKRHRNRLAASKCRRRKLELISKLEEKVKHLKGENMELGQTINRLRIEVSSLKEKVIRHASNGCRIIVTSGY